jgi:hypothetical protein
MPPRYAYWTILIDGKATAFRAREREELVPTFNQLARKNTDIAMKYFARGKLWDTPEQAQWAGKNLGRETPGDKRSRDWRPGGEHKDPRARFLKSKDRSAKRAPRFPSSQPSGGPPAIPTTKPDKRPSSFERSYVQPKDRAVRPQPAPFARPQPAPVARPKDRDQSHTPYVQPRDRGKPSAAFEPRANRAGGGTPDTRYQKETRYQPPTDRGAPPSRYRPPTDRRTPASPYVQPKDRRKSDLPPGQQKGRAEPDTRYVQPKDRGTPATPYVQPKDRGEQRPETAPAKPRGRWRPPPDRKPR